MQIVLANYCLLCKDNEKFIYKYKNNSLINHLNCEYSSENKHVKHSKIIKNNKTNILKNINNYFNTNNTLLQNSIANISNNTKYFNKLFLSENKNIENNELKPFENKNIIENNSKIYTPSNINNILKNKNIDETEYNQFWNTINNEYFSLNNYNKINPGLLSTFDIIKKSESNNNLELLELLLNGIDSRESLTFLVKPDTQNNILFELKKRDNILNKDINNNNNGIKFTENLKNNSNINLKPVFNNINYKHNNDDLTNILNYNFDYYMLNNVETDILNNVEIEANRDKISNINISKLIKYLKKYKTYISNKSNLFFNNVKAKVNDNNLLDFDKYIKYVIKLCSLLSQLLDFYSIVNNFNYSISQVYNDDDMPKEYTVESNKQIETDCMVCFSPLTPLCNPIIYCSSCSNSFHKNCYLIDKISNDEIFCDYCLLNYQKNIKERAECKICKQSELTMKKIGNSYYHLSCLFFNNMIKIYFDKNNIEIIKNKNSNNCDICNKDGVTQKCFKCNNGSFHMLCGYLEGMQIITDNIFINENIASIIKQIKLFDNNNNYKKIYDFIKDFKQYYINKSNYKIICNSCNSLSLEEIKKYSEIRKYNINYKNIIKKIIN